MPPRKKQKQEAKEPKAKEVKEPKEEKEVKPAKTTRQSKVKAKAQEKAAEDEKHEEAEQQQEEMKIEEEVKEPKEEKEVKQAKTTRQSKVRAKAQEKAAEKHEEAEQQQEEMKIEEEAKAKAAEEKAVAEDDEEDESKGTPSGVKEGDTAPEFTVKNQDEKDISLSAFAGKKVVLYFYPKDNTPGCTQEGKKFKDLYEEFEAVSTVVLGVSADKPASHKKFIDKHEFPFELLADTTRTVIKAYGAHKPGNKINRSTVVIGTDGKVAKVWSTVKGVAKHPEEVLEFVKTM